MLHIPDSVLGRHRPYVARARAERAKVISGLLSGTATGVRTVGRWAAGGVGRFGRAVVSGVIPGHRRRAAIRELTALDDRLLKDIGISRGQILLVVDEKLAASRNAGTESAGQCEIAAFPDQNTNKPRTLKSFRRAA